MMFLQQQQEVLQTPNPEKIVPAKYLAKDTNDAFYSSPRVIVKWRVLKFRVTSRIQISNDNDKVKRTEKRFAPLLFPARPLSHLSSSSHN